jgi:hypothetical protein
MDDTIASLIARLRNSVKLRLMLSKVRMEHGAVMRPYRTTLPAKTVLIGANMDGETPDDSVERILQMMEMYEHHSRSTDTNTDNDKQEAESK